MKKIKLTILLAISSLFLTSCSTMHWLYGDYGAEDLNTKYIEYADKEEPKLIVNKLKKDGLVSEDCINSTLFRPTDDSWNKTCLSQRATIIGDLVAISDAACEDHKRSIWGNDAAFNIITGTLTNAFSGAATVVTGGTGQAILAGLALFSNAERSLGNETVYKNMVVPAIVKKIDEHRAIKLQALKQSIYKSPKPYDEYPLNVAILDLSNYHNSCSFMFGLQKAIDEGTKDTRLNRISELNSLLTKLSDQIDLRKYKLKSENKNITDEQINSDKQYSNLKSRYDAVSEQLKTLETAVESASAAITPSKTPENGDNSGKDTDNTEPPPENKSKEGSTISE